MQRCGPTCNLNPPRSESFMPSAASMSMRGSTARALAQLQVPSDHGVTPGRTLPNTACTATFILPQPLTATMAAKTRLLRLTILQLAHDLQVDWGLAPVLLFSSSTVSACHTACCKSSKLHLRSAGSRHRSGIGQETQRHSLCAAARSRHCKPWAGARSAH